MNKIQFSRIDPKEQPPISVKIMIAKLFSGGSERCAACFNWISWNKLGVVASFESHAGAEPIAYTCCGRCMNKAAQSAEAWIATHKQITKYLTGDYNKTVSK